MSKIDYMNSAQRTSLVISNLSFGFASDLKTTEYHDGSLACLETATFPVCQSLFISGASQSLFQHKMSLELVALFEKRLGSTEDWPTRASSMPGTNSICPCKGNASEAFVISARPQR